MTTNCHKIKLGKFFLGYHTSLYSLPNILDATTVFQGLRSNFEIEGRGEGEVGTRYWGKGFKTRFLANSRSPLLGVCTHAAY